MSTQLHGHTTFSKLDAYGLPERAVERAIELGLKGIGITEHGNTSSHPKLEMAIKKKGGNLKPLYGVELYMNTKEQKKNHITIIAKNLNGYKNLLRLSSLAYEEGYFYYLPSVDLPDIYQYQKDLIILSGCMSGKAAQAILNNDYEEAERIILEMADNIEHFFVEIQPLNMEESRKINWGLINIAQKHEIPMVATNDSHFVELDDRDLQHFFAMVRRRSNIREMPKGLDERCRMASHEDYVNWLAEYGADVAKEALENQDKICDMVEQFDLPKAENVRMTDEPEEVRYQRLVQHCRDGWKFRLPKIPKEKREEYGERLRHELKVIRQKSYVDYFLVVEDMVKWAKNNNILVAPARGSGGGSLVSWLLRISEVDPIRWGLLFERFLDPCRNDPPDIDLDFQDDRRDEVKAYLAEKYGYERVANVAGYTIYHEKSLLDDIGRCYNIPKMTIEAMKNEWRGNGGKLTFEEVITKLREGFPNSGIPANIGKVLGQLRGYTKHAAGVIVSTMPIEETTTITRDGIYLDKRDAEYMNLLKIDALSLKTLRVIALALEKIGMTVDELYNLPFDDPDVFRGFQEGKMQGIFQFEGQTTKNILVRALKEYDMNTADMAEVMGVIIDTNTLSRPASLNNGSTSRYLNRNSESIHPLLDAVTEKTRGQIIYQEQIMDILSRLGIDWKYITPFMKGKIKPEMQEELEIAFKEALKSQWDTLPELADEVWERLGDAEAYGFNKSHCVAYTIVSYYTMWLKVNYPLEFYWANMVVTPDNDDMLREYIQSGGTVLPVRFGKSQKFWSIDEKRCLRAGYTSVKGIGEVSANKLMQYKTPDEIPPGIRAKLEAVKAFDADPEIPDYLGLERMKKKLKAINNRVKISRMKDKELVHVGCKIAEFKVKNLKEFYDKNGMDYSEVKDGHLEIYINMRIYDESGECLATLNRYKAADNTVYDAVVNSTKEDVFEIWGEYNKERNKIYVTRFQKML